MGENIIALTGGHKCPHGARRATAQFVTYGGRVVECSCCRSPFGANHYDGTECPTCREDTDETVVGERG